MCYLRHLLNLLAQALPELRLQILIGVETYFYLLLSAKLFEQLKN